MITIFRILCRNENVLTFPHSSHRKGFSPVCRRMCEVSVPFWLNALPHTTHRYGRSPVCIRRCSRQWYFCMTEMGTDKEEKNKPCQTQPQRKYALEILGKPLQTEGIPIVTVSSSEGNRKLGLYDLSQRGKHYIGVKLCGSFLALHNRGMLTDMFFWVSKCSCVRMFTCQSHEKIKTRNLRSNL